MLIIVLPCAMSGAERSKPAVIFLQEGLREGGETLITKLNWLFGGRFSGDRVEI
jgi:hypothetical protein